MVCHGFCLFFFCCHVWDKVKCCDCLVSRRVSFDKVQNRCRVIKCQHRIIRAHFQLFRARHACHPQNFVLRRLILWDGRTLHWLHLHLLCRVHFPPAGILVVWHLVPSFGHILPDVKIRCVAVVCSYVAIVCNFSKKSGFFLISLLTFRTLCGIIKER